MRAVFDLEADGLLDELTVIHCAVVKNIDTNEIRSFDPSNIGDLCAYLETADTLIGHNCIAYDFPALAKVFGWEWEGEKIDTLLMSRSQRPNRLSPPKCSTGPHSVEAWGIRLGRHKVTHDDWTEFSPEMLHRCVEDTHIQHEILNALLKEGEGEGWEDAHKLNMKLFHYLERQERYGWLVDRDHFDKCITTLDRWIDRIDRAVAPYLPQVVEILEIKKDDTYSYIRKPFRKDGSYSATIQSYLGEGMDVCAGPFSRIRFRPTNLDSNAETKLFLLAQGWEPKEWNVNNEGKQTSPKLSKLDPFEGINSGLGKLIAKRVQCRHRKSQIEGWQAAIRPDGRISARVGGIATTGRLKHAVIVNVPNSDSFFGEWMRKGFVAKPGWVLVGTDSKGNQMRQLIGRMKALDGVGDVEFEKAELTGDKRKGTDLHSVNQRRAGLASRTLAKNFFYGCILFGAGDKKTAKIMGAGTTIEQARAKKAEFFEGLPVLRKLLDTEIAKWRASAQKIYNKKFNRIEHKNGYIRGLDGRPILVEFEKDILVYFLQSDEALQLGAAYCWAHKQLEKRGYKWREDYGFVIWMHDEVQVECRAELAEEVAEICCEAIAWAGRYFGIQCEHAGEAKIGKNWAETH